MPKTTDRILLVIGDEKHLVDPGKLLLSEIVAAEKATGLTWPQVWVGVNQGQAQAIQAVVWLMRKRSNPRLRLSEVEFAMGDYRMKDPDFDPEYWVPDGDDDELPGEGDTAADADTEDDAPEHDGGPKAEDPPQDTQPEV